MAEAKVRKATLEDIPLVSGLWTEFMALHDGLVLKGNRRLEPYVEKRGDAAERYGKFLRENLESGKGAVFIAEVGGKPAGYTLLYVKEEIPIFKIEKLGYISDLYVREEFRGGGISSRLRDEAEKWFREQGVGHMSILLYKDNEFARRVYEKWGFFDYKLEMRKTL